MLHSFQNNVLGVFVLVGIFRIGEHFRCLSRSLSALSLFRVLIGLHPLVLVVSFFSFTTFFVSSTLGSSNTLKIRQSSCSPRERRHSHSISKDTCRLLLFFICEVPGVTTYVAKTSCAVCITYRPPIRWS
jgi:hypothetical protein